MAKWLAKEFDWDTGRYTGRYYDIAESGIVAVFVDSFYGDDANDGTDPDTPYKTLGAAITYLNANGANGSRIFMNGVFEGSLPAQTYWYDFIGCGGGRNGRTIFKRNSLNNSVAVVSVNLTKWQNIELLDYNNLFYWANGAGRLYMSYFFLNCIFKNVTITAFENYFDTNYDHMSYCIMQNAYSGRADNRGIGIVGGFNIFINVTRADGATGLRLLASNNYIDRVGSFGQITGSGNIIATDAQFLDQANGNFSVYGTSPLLLGGTYNEFLGRNENVGGVLEGIQFNGAIRNEFREGGGATITNLVVDTLGRFIIAVGETRGTLESAIIDLKNFFPLENINIQNAFDYSLGEITQGVFEDFSGQRPALSIKLKFGNTEAEVNECPWLLIEYGKRPTYSGIGASRVGNADDAFDTGDVNNITCRYLKLFITLQNNS